jgi:hypothetical protein
MKNKQNVAMVRMIWQLFLVKTKALQTFRTRFTLPFLVILSKLPHFGHQCRLSRHSCQEAIFAK